MGIIGTPTQCTARIAMRAPCARRARCVRMHARGGGGGGVDSIDASQQPTAAKARDACAGSVDETASVPRLSGRLTRSNFVSDPRTSSFEGARARASAGPMQAAGRRCPEQPKFGVRGRGATPTRF